MIWLKKEKRDRDEEKASESECVSQYYVSEVGGGHSEDTEVIRGVEDRICENKREVK